VLRLAILSDIHSNLEALTTAFGIIDDEDIDQVVCLGDIVGYGANPNECVDLIRRRCPTVIQGNHDAAVINAQLTETFSHNARTAVQWTRMKLSDENVKFLQSLPYTAIIEELLFVHASPCEPERWRYIVDSWEARQAFACFDERGCFIGHSHVPGIFSPDGREETVRRGMPFLVNVGSVGQPRDRNPKLSFGIFDSEAWSYRNIRAEYDIETASRKILQEGLPTSLAQRLALGI
jgi:diadenosine tetraphosphatase ApaH/serine/threonine PP2A family protein phosphatase